MKKAIFLISLVAMFGLIFTGCEDKVVEKYKANVPIYLEYSKLRSAVKDADPIEISKPGKIYFKDNYLFVNEVEEGIHIIDNSDPSSPTIIKFIEIPGCVDLAIKENILYADSYIDLVALDISDIEDIKEVARIEEVFPYNIAPYETDYRVQEVNEEKGVVIGWQVKEVTEDIENIDNYEVYPWYYYESANKRYDVMIDATFATSQSGVSSTGTGGSMARFTVCSDYLYAVDNSRLVVFDVSSPEDPLASGEQSIGWNIETIFPYDNKLFIGTQTGMLIYDISTTPEIPSMLSSYSHITSCDPVVVEGNYAYVTLRSGNLCGSVTDQLDVVDISKISNPQLVKSYDMENPHGLGIDEGTLFICDGDSGLKVYDATDPLKIDKNLISHFPDINSFDVIPVNGVLMMIGSDGIYQYDYSDLENITLLSHLVIITE